MRSGRPTAPVDLDQIGHCRVEPLLEILVGHANDYPVDPHQLTVAPLVPLRGQSSTVPGDVIHLDPEPHSRIGKVEVEPYPAAKIDAHLRFELHTVGRQRAEQPNLEIGILGPVPGGPRIENSSEPADAITAAPGKPPTTRMERRHGNQTPIDQLLDHGFEIVVIEEPGKVCSEPDRTEQTDAIVASGPVP